MSLNSLLEKVNETLKEPFDWSEVDRAMIKLHEEISKPKLAIEDERIRGECEKLIVQWAANKYTQEDHDQSN